MEKQNHTIHASVTTYTIGFVLSLILTLAAYFAVDSQWLTGWQLVGAVIALALTQFFVQTVLFLHVGDETRPRWNMTSFLFMIIIVGTVVIGSLWIMANLNYNMMSPEQMDSYMRAEAQKGF